MFDSLRKKLYFAKFRAYGAKMEQEGKITGFDDEIYEKMKGTIVACFPVSFHIKHSNHMFSLGTCYDRSLFMFLALDDALLVRGNNKDLEYNYGKGHGGHGWVEVGDYVYDPSIMARFEKEVYYKLYDCSNVTKVDKETYLREHKDFVDMVASRDYDEFKPGGKRRLDLGLLVTQIQAIAGYLNDEDFNRDLEEYLEAIQYDADQIQEERNRVIEELLKDEMALALVSGNKLTK